MTIELGAALTLISLVIGALVWLFGQISGAREDFANQIRDVTKKLADHQVATAEKYVSKEGFREMMGQFFREMQAQFKHLSEKVEDIRRGRGE